MVAAVSFHCIHGYLSLSDYHNNCGPFFAFRIFPFVGIVDDQRLR
jgi:hypothetical protein